MVTTQEFCKQYWTPHKGNTPQSSSYMATYHPIMKTVKVRRTRHAGHCWRSRDELISDVLLWTPLYGWAKAWQPVQTYIQQLCANTGCSPEDQPESMDDREGWQQQLGVDTRCSPEDLSEVMNDREGWRERVRDICAEGTTRWWLVLCEMQTAWPGIWTLVAKSNSSDNNCYLIHHQDTDLIINSAGLPKKLL